MLWFGKKKRQERRAQTQREVAAIKSKLVQDAKDTTEAVRDVNKFLDNEDVALVLFIASGGKEKK